VGSNGYHSGESHRVMSEFRESQGYIVLTLYEPRRRWFGRLRSFYTLDRRRPVGDGSAEVVHTLLTGWTSPNYAYNEIRFPVSIKELFLGKL
jgi:hypothetical protein